MGQRQNPELLSRQNAEVGDQQQSVLTHFELYRKTILRTSLSINLSTLAQNYTKIFMCHLIDIDTFIEQALN